MVIALPDPSSLSHSSQLRREISQVKVKRLLGYSLIISLAIFFVISSNTSTIDSREWRRWFYGDDRVRDARGWQSQSWHRQSRYPPSRNRLSDAITGPETGTNGLQDSSLPILTTSRGSDSESGDAGQEVSNSSVSTSLSNSEDRPSISKSSASTSSGQYNCHWDPESGFPALLLAITSRRTAFKQRSAIREAYRQILPSNIKVKIEFYIRQRDSSERRRQGISQAEIARDRNNPALNSGIERRELRFGHRLMVLFVNTIRFFDPRNWFPLLTQTSTGSRASLNSLINVDKSTEQGKKIRETWLERRLRQEMMEHQDVIELDVRDQDSSTFRACQMFHHISRRDMRPAYVMKTDEVTLVDVARVLESLALTVGNRDDGTNQLGCDRNIYWGSSSFTWHRSLSGNQVYGRHSYMLSWPLVARIGNLESGQPDPSRQFSATSSLPSLSKFSLKGPETAAIEDWLTLLPEEVLHVDWKEELHGWLEIGKGAQGTAAVKPSLATRYLWRPEMWRQASDELLEWRRRG